MQVTNVLHASNEIISFPAFQVWNEGLTLSGRWYRSREKPWSYFKEKLQTVAAFPQVVIDGKSRNPKGMRDALDRAANDKETVLIEGRDDG